MEKFIKLIIHYSLSLIIFLFPLFFLPFTQEFFLTNKLYLLTLGSLFLLLLSFILYLFSKKISWRPSPLETRIFLFLLTIASSIIIISPNKIQALLNPNFGLVPLVSLAILYFYLSRLFSLSLIHYSLLLSSLILSVTTLIFFLQPFKNTNLPPTLQFLKNPFFTPIGNQLDLAIFLGFMIVYGVTRIITERTDGTDGAEGMKKIIHYSSVIVSSLALSVALYNLFNLFKPTPPDSNRFQLSLPPFRLSWYAAVETLKQPLTALFGVGVDNFSSVFTRVKDLAYNQSRLWQISSFAASSSALLHLFTETGLFGLIAFSLLLSPLIKESKKSHLSQNLIIYYSLFIILFFPPSLITWFLFFIALTFSTSQLEESTSLHLAPFPPVYLGLAGVFFLIIVGLSYLSIRSYLAEYYFKKGFDGVIKNNAKEAYDNTRLAIILNPYIERFRINFSQINLLIANNIIQRANQNNDQKKPLSETDRQNISQAIQVSISEAKAAIALNPQKGESWQNLATIYQQIIPLAQGADLWTISAYQRAIVLDPHNPIYRLNLGGVYYSLGNFQDASRAFENAVILKPDWPNGHYNLAWADYQSGNYQRAVSEMENVLSLLNPKTNKTDYEKAKKELEEFRKKLPAEEKKATESASPPQLKLPTPISTSQPQIELPKEASPEAK